MADSDKKDGTREQWAKPTGADHRTDFEKAKSTLPLRIGAFALWIASALVEVAGVLVLSGKLHLSLLADLPILTAILAVVICIVLTVVAQRLWKSAGAGSKSRGQGQTGVVMASVGFAPWALFFLVSKNLPGKTKALGCIAALLMVVLVVVLIKML